MGVIPQQDLDVGNLNPSCWTDFSMVRTLRAL